ncbi:MAG: hypothetical protein Q9167_001918 [Letrouitia subvulpina]
MDSEVSEANHSPEFKANNTTTESTSVPADGVGKRKEACIAAHQRFRARKERREKEILKEQVDKLSKENEDLKRQLEILAAENEALRASSTSLPQRPSPRL